MNFPHFNPEAIGSALFTLLQTAQGLTANGKYPFVTMDRRGQVPQNVPALNQPYMGLLELGGDQVLASSTSVQLGTQGLEKWVLQFAVLVYIRADADPSTVPATQLNAAWLAIVNVLRSTPIGERQTLGGLVDNAYVFGNCIMNAGVIDVQCTLSIPVLVDLGT